MLLVVRWVGGGGSWLAGAAAAVARPVPVVGQPLQREVGAAELGYGGRVYCRDQDSDHPRRAMVAAAAATASSPLTQCPRTHIY